MGYWLPSELLHIDPEDEMWEKLRRQQILMVSYFILVVEGQDSWQYKQDCLTWNRKLLNGPVVWNYTPGGPWVSIAPFLNLRTPNV